MLAVHFGAGNIGRGFIGKILVEAGYKVIFVDVNSEFIDALNDQQAYTVFYAEEEKREFKVSNVSGLHSVSNRDDVIRSVSEADLVTTAVGAHVLPHLGEIVAAGLKLKLERNNNSYLNVIACENAIGGTEILKEAIDSSLSNEEQSVLSEFVGFPNAAVDRIVPNQHQENMLDVLVEPFFEWVVEKGKIAGTLPPVSEIHFVDDLEAFIERKLFTVNTGHAVAAYLGYYEGMKTIDEALKNETIYNKVFTTLLETGTLITKKHDFELDDHKDYIKKILGRFLNPYIVDEVTRVARQPIKKLGKKERLVSPACQLMEYDIPPKALTEVIALALKYDFTGDQEAVDLQNRISADGAEKAFSSVSGLDENHLLVRAVGKKYAEFS